MFFIQIASAAITLLLIAYLSNSLLYSLKSHYIVDKVEPVLNNIIELLSKTDFAKRQAVAEALGNKYSLEIIVEQYADDESLEALQGSEENSYQSFFISEGETGPYIETVLSDNSAMIAVGPFSEFSWLDWVEIFFYGLLLVASQGLALWFSLKQLRNRSQLATNSLLQLLEQKEVALIEDGQQDFISDLNKAINQTAKKITQTVKNREVNVLHQRDLLHGVAHEFRSPMSRINFANQMLMETLPEQEQVNLSIDIDKALLELNKLVKEVLEFARLQYPKLAIDIKSYDICEIIESIDSNLSHYKTSIKVNNLVAENSFFALDQHLFYRALINIIRNGKRFADKQLVISLQKEATVSRLIIEDDGNGIPPGKRERIFEPFTRLDPSRSRESGGVGLGLAISKQIIELHQATIAVEQSQLGGAKFIIEFPLSKLD